MGQKCRRFTRTHSEPRQPRVAYELFPRAPAERFNACLFHPSLAAQGTARPTLIGCPGMEAPTRDLLTTKALAATTAVSPAPKRAFWAEFFVWLRRVRLLSPLSLPETSSLHSKHSCCADFQCLGPSPPPPLRSPFPRPPPQRRSWEDILRFTRYTVAFPDEYDADELSKLSSSALDAACQKAFRAKSLEMLMATWAHQGWRRAVYKRPSQWCAAVCRTARCVA